METEGRTLGPRQVGAEVLDAREVQGILGLLKTRMAGEGHRP